MSEAEHIIKDTPEGGPEELQWKIDRLIIEVQRHTKELQRERSISADLRKQIAEHEARFDRLTGMLTVRDLRKAGVHIELTMCPDDDDTCDCGCCD